MNKTELIERIAATTKMSQKDTNAFFKGFVEVVEATLKNGDDVVIPGFGSFVIATRSARTARNFHTGKNIEVPATKCVRFKVGKTLKEAVKAS